MYAHRFICTHTHLHCKVLTLGPYAQLILVLRRHSNFLVVWTKCARGAFGGSLGAHGRLLPAVRWQGRVCGGYVWRSKCLGPSFLPPVLVNRWNGGRPATWLGTSERGSRGVHVTMLASLERQFKTL